MVRDCARAVARSIRNGNEGLDSFSLASLDLPVVLKCRRHACLRRRANRGHIFARLPPGKRGVSRSSLNVGGRCGGRGARNRRMRARGRRSRDVLIPRRWYQLGDDACASRRGWWQESPITRETTKETVKTIARGMPEGFGEPVVTNSCAFFHCTRGCGRAKRPAFPAPSLRGSCFAASGRIRVAEMWIRGRLT